MQGKQLTQEEFVLRANEIHSGKGYKYLDPYIHNTTKMRIECPKHGVFIQSPRVHLIGKCGCPFCWQDKHKEIRKETCLKRALKAGNEFKNKANKIFNYFYDYSKTVYINAHTKVIIGCSKHGDFNQIPTSHLSGKGCPHCSESSGERAVRNFLIRHGINFTPQKTFIGCVGKKFDLPFDFFLPDYNLCIEYQGEQHYRPIKFWGGEKQLKEVQQRDLIKKNFCAENGIRYLSIPYTEDPISILTSTLGIDIK